MGQAPFCQLAEHWEKAQLIAKTKFIFTTLFSMDKILQ